MTAGDAIPQEGNETPPIDPKRVDEYRAERGDLEAQQRLREGNYEEVAPAAEATPSEAPLDDEAALADWLRENKPTVDETVALAGDDPEKARVVLAAEEAATGGKPRAGVVKALSGE